MGRECSVGFVNLTKYHLIFDQIQQHPLATN